MKFFSFIHNKLKRFKFYRGILLLLKIQKSEGFIKHTLITEYNLKKY